MGIYTRDYFRDRSSSWGGPIPPVCKGLIIANVVVFLLQIFITRPTTPKDLQALLERRERPAAEKKKSAREEESAESKTKGSAETPRSSGSAEKPAQVEKKPARDEKRVSVEKRPEPDEDVDEEDLAAVLPSISIVEEWFELDAHKVVYQGQVWRLITNAFCHDRFGVWHILFNMLFLYYFGRMLEPLYGSREFLIFYLTAAVVSSLCYIGLDLFTHRSVPAIGASGAVMAVVVLYAIHYPRDRFYIFMMVPIEIRWLVLIYVIVDLHPVLLALSGTPVETGVANAAHLGGAAFGFLYWRSGLRLEKYWDRATRQARLARLRLTREVRLHRPRDEPDRDHRGADELDELVDAILQKVHEHGRDSITERERKVLKAAAERYKR